MNSRTAWVWIILVPNFHISINNIFQRIKGLKRLIRRCCTFHCFFSFPSYHVILSTHSFLWKFHWLFAHSWVNYWLQFSVLVKKFWFFCQPVTSLLIPSFLDKSCFVVFGISQVEHFHFCQIHLLFTFSKWYFFFILCLVFILLFYLIVFICLSYLCLVLIHFCFFLFLNVSH